MLPPEVIFEDNHLLALNKPPGWLVQGDATGDVPLSDWAKNYIKEKYGKPGEVYLAVLHRLDRPVSGLVLFGRTSKAAARMSALFQARTGLEKKYWAVVERRPQQPEGTLTHWLVKDAAKNKSRAYHHPVKQAKEAKLNYTLLRSLDRYHLLEVELHTGRHHQIRAQLAAMGCPIKGDLKYGAARSNPDGSIHLHARSLRFEHPVQKSELHLIAPVPSGDALWKACQE